MNSISSLPAPPYQRDQIMTFVIQTVLYHARGTTVTTEFFESDGRRYPLAELGIVHRAVPAGWPRRRLFELWAEFRGRPVRLYRCRSERVFGQVCRALLRAREYAELG